MKVCQESTFPRMFVKIKAKCRQTRFSPEKMFLGNCMCTRVLCLPCRIYQGASFYSLSGSLRVKGSTKGTISL